MWHTLKFPTSDLKFRNTRNPFGEGVYKEKSSHERDIQSMLGEKKGRTILSHASPICTQHALDG